jgi:structure-specific recognition protein 1
MRGPTHVILSRVLKAFTERPVIIPGKSYVSADGFSKFLSCSYKANAGFLFMLEKSFFFSNKPPMLIRHDDIESIEFARMEQGFSGRMFDLVLKVRGEKPMTFTNVDRKEYNNLFDFLVKKDMHIDNLKTRKQQRNKISGRSAARVSYMDEDMQDEEDDEDEDEDFEVNSDGSSSESDSDLGSEISGDGGVDSEDEAPKRKKKVPAEKKEKKPKKPKVTKEEKQSKAKVLAKKLKKAGIKRPASAYALFVKEIRSQVVAENPSWGFKEISVEVGMRWKACPEEKKEAYKAQYVQAKAEFEEKVKELPDLSDGEESDKKKKKKKKKDPDAPKRALSGYQCFLRGERENIKRDHPEVGPKDLFKKFGEVKKRCLVADAVHPSMCIRVYLCVVICMYMCVYSFTPYSCGRSSLTR